MSIERFSQSCPNNDQVHMKSEQLEGISMVSTQRQCSLVIHNETESAEDKLQILNELVEHEDSNSFDLMHEKERVKLLYDMAKYEECLTAINRISSMSDLSGELLIINIKCSIRMMFKSSRQSLLKIINESDENDPTHDEVIELLARLTNDNANKFLGDNKRKQNNRSKRQKLG